MKDRIDVSEESTTISIGNIEFEADSVTATATVGDVPTMGIKHDHGKLDWSLIPWGVLSVALEVIMWGCGKYGRGNWKQVEGGKERFFAALIRHYTALVGGETHDVETGIHHAGHIVVNAIFMAWFWLQEEVGDNDRE